MIKTKHNLDKAYTIIGVEMSRPGKKLSRKRILEQIRTLMKNCFNDRGGTYVYFWVPK